MKNLKKKHKVTALLFLTIMLLHLFAFHDDLDGKVLCIGDGDHFHLENINDSHLGNQNTIVKESEKETFRPNDNCEDYLLDKHIDEIFERGKKNLLNNFVKISTLNPKVLLNSMVVNSFTHDINSIQKNTLELLPTVILLV